MLKNILLRSIIKQTLIWTLAFGFWTMMRNYGLELERTRIDEPTFIQWVKIHLMLGLTAGVIFGSLSYLYEYVLFRKLKFGMLALLSSISYLAAIVLIAGIAAGLFTKVLDLDQDAEIFKGFILSKTGVLFISYCFIVGFLVDIFKEINKKFGPGNLMKMIRGEFHEPKEDERIFMFLDLKSSTTYAEQLGHIKFSRLIQDCFSDLDVVFPFKAEIYQYVGDEVVLSWPLNLGLENSNCLRAFFAYTHRLTNRSGYYTKEYGFVPEFKAGINLGKITVAEVGDIKREIAFHGDVLNTAARIQGQCNQLGEQFLASETLITQLKEENPYFSKEVGLVRLRGKIEEVKLFSIHEN